MLFTPNGWHFNAGSCKVFNGFGRKWHLHLPGASPNQIGDGEEAPPSELSSWWLAHIKLKTPCVTSQDVTRTSDWKQSGARARCVWSLTDHADHAGVWRFHSVLENLIFSDMIADSWRSCRRRKGELWHDITAISEAMLLTITSWSFNCTFCWSINELGHLNPSEFCQVCQSVRLGHRHEQIS